MVVVAVVVLTQPGGLVTAGEGSNRLRFGPGHCTADAARRPKRLEILGGPINGDLGRGI